MWEAIQETKQMSMAKKASWEISNFPFYTVFGGACYMLSAFCLPRGYGIPYHCHGVGNSYLAGVLAEIELA